MGINSIRFYVSANEMRSINLLSSVTSYEACVSRFWPNYMSISAALRQVVEQICMRPFAKRTQISFTRQCENNPQSGKENSFSLCRVGVTPMFFSGLSLKISGYDKISINLQVKFTISLICSDIYSFALGCLTRCNRIYFDNIGFNDIPNEFFNYTNAIVFNDHLIGYLFYYYFFTLLLLLPSSWKFGGPLNKIRFAFYRLPPLIRIWLSLQFPADITLLCPCQRQSMAIIV